MQWPRRLISTIVITASAVGIAGGQDWPRFRGPDGLGVARTSSLPGSFTDDDVVWRRPVGGAGHSSPVVVGDQLFLTREGDDEGSREVVCFDAESGEELWSHSRRFEAYPLHRWNSFASSTPTADADGVYVVWVTGGELVALALNRSGELRWRRSLGSFSAQHGSGTSPVLFDGALIVANDNAGDGFLEALETATGESRWRIERDSSPRRCSYASPVVCRPSDAKPYLLFASAHGLTAVDATTGVVRWQADLGFRTRCVGTPAVNGGRVVVTAGTGGSGKDGAVVRVPDHDGGEAEVLYRLRRNIPYVPATIALGDRIYLFADGGIASCLDALSGDVVWRQRFDGTFFSSPVSDGEVIHIADREGRLHSLAAHDEFQSLGQLDLGAAVFATPAIARGALYVRTGAELICLAGQNRRPR